MKKFIYCTIITFLFVSGIVVNAQTERSIASPISPGEKLLVNSQSNTKGVQSLPSITITGDEFVDGGNRLAALQNEDGAWAWPLTGPSVTNTLAPIAMGLVEAYQHSGSSTQYAALELTAENLLNKTNDFSTYDGILAAKLDKIFGVTSYTEHVKEYYYDKLAAGEYDRKGAGTLYNTAGYVEFVRNSRTSSIANLAAWDLGLGIIAADLCGASTSEWIAGTKAELNEISDESYYNVLGLAGGIYGLHFVGEEFDPTSGYFADAGSLSELADSLASYQINGGGFAWDVNYVIPDDANESLQETAYSILALNEIDRSKYIDVIESAADYISSIQLETGGWANSLEEDEYNELTGEALWGMGVAYPAPVYNVTKDVYYSGIQAAINSASVNDSLVIANGTYTLTAQLSIGQAVKLIGESQAGVIIDASANGKGYGILIQANDVTLGNVTIIPPKVAASYGTGNGGGYAIHASFNSKTTPKSRFNNLTIEDITIAQSNRTGLDIHGYAGVTINSVTITDAAYGNGISFTGCSDVSISNVTTSGNAWGGVAIYCSGTSYLNIPSSDITINLSENSIGEWLYVEDEFGLVNTNISIGNYEYVVSNKYSSEANYKAYLGVDIEDAYLFGESLNTKFSNSLSIIMNSSGEIYVGPGVTIQAAVDAASAGDVINVAAGTYAENVTIDKELTLLGEDKETTIIDGSETGSVVTISSDNVALSGFTIQNSGLTGTEAGIALSGVSGCYISDNIITDNFAGVGMVSASSDTIKSNTISQNNFGIYLGDVDTPSTGNLISGNTISGSVTSATIENCGDGIYADQNNHGNTYVNNTIKSNEGNGIYFWKSAGNTVSTNKISSNTKNGIALMGSANNLFTSNIVKLNGEDGYNIRYSGYPVDAYPSFPNTITDDEISGNGGYSVYAENEVDSVNAENTWWGTTKESEITPLLAGNVLYDPWEGKPVSITESDTTATITPPGTNASLKFTSLPEGTNATVSVQQTTVRPDTIPTPIVDSDDEELNIYLEINAEGLTNGDFEVTIVLDVSSFEGFDATTSKVMFYDTSSSTWVTIEDGEYDPIEKTFTFTINHFTLFTFVNDVEALPVEISSFTANVVDGEVVLAWTTLTEVNNYGFEVERKISGSDDWTTLDFVPGNGTTNSAIDYEFVDSYPPSESLQYRLKQIDNSGSYSYFKSIVNVDLTVTGVEENEVPTEFKLEQNYPNPFNPATKIEFSIPESVAGNTVKLIIYDILGNKVATLVNKELSAGVYTVDFNASRLASGVYFYSLNVNDLHSIKKMVLLK